MSASQTFSLLARSWIDSKAHAHCDIFREGLFFRALGRAQDSNPYLPGSDDSLSWSKSWEFVDMEMYVSSANSSNLRVETFAIYPIGVIDARIVSKTIVSLVAPIFRGGSFAGTAASFISFASLLNILRSKRVSASSQ